MITRLFTILICVFCLSPVLWAQDKNIKGTVTEESGEALPGVNVIVKGTSIGTVTLPDGTFSLQIPEDAVTLVISFIGFTTQYIDISGKNNVQVQLKADAIGLEEVVAVGYATQKKINLTGAIENVQVQDLESRSITNAGLALQGKVAGVTVTQNSGQPGQDEAIIRIRGISSIENNNDPLVIIDGIEGKLEDVHPKNIASMTVLKDASSAAIYGNRAAAGVIIITTKQGDGGLHVNFSATSSVQQPTALPETVSGYTYASLLNEARLNSGFPNVPYDDEKLEIIQSGEDPRLQSLDLYNLYFSPALMQNYYGAIKGGQKNYNFAFSLGYLDQDGVLYGTGATKLTYRANLNSKFVDNKLRVGMVLGGYNKNEKELASSTASVMTSIATSSPLGFIQVQDTITGEKGLYGGKARYLAMEEAGGGITRERNNFNYTVNAEIDLLKGLTIKALYGQNINKYQYIRLVPSVPIAGNVYEDQVSSVTQSELQKTVSNSTNTTFTATMNYKLQLNSHNFDFMGGYEFLTYNYDEDNSAIKNLISNAPSFSFGDPETMFLSSSIRERSNMSYFGRFNYNIKDKYLFEANVRRDGSSRFAKENRWGIFPSFSAGWRLSEEPFMKSLDFLYVKLRASWGQLGNELISVYYPSFDVLEPGQYYSFGGTVYQGTATTLLANRDITWELTEQTNVGLDVELFRNYSISLNYFNKLTTDILGRIDIPLSVGLGSDVSSKPYQNIGTMRNNGVELTFDYNNSWKSWTFRGNINATYLKNEIIDLGGLDYVSHGVESGYQPPADIIRSQVGNPFGAYYGLIVDRIYQVEDFIWQNNSDPNIGHYDRFYSLKPDFANPSSIFRNPMPGDIKFKDLSGPDGEKDNLITNDDIIMMGSSQPDIILALNLAAEYKNLSLNILGQGAFGGNAYIMGAMLTPFWGGRGNISTEIAENRWNIDSPSQTHQAVYDDSQRANVVSSYYLQDASYFRIKNIELGYRLDIPYLKANGIDEVRFNLSIENAFTFSNLSGFDPEKSFNKITGDFHPQIRIYSLGININL